MKLILDRKYCKDTYTIGKLYVETENGNIWIADTMEDVVRDYNKDGDLLDEGETKVYGESAIPYGKYEVVMCVSNKFKPRFWGIKYNGITPLISNVKHFDGIRIHPQIERASHSQGCIGVGRNTEKGRITQTIEMYYHLMDKYLMPAYERGEKITLEIV